MVATQSTMLELGTRAPAFNLPEPATGEKVSLRSVAAQNGLLVAFICNHCPYVKHLIGPLVQLSKELQSEDIGVVAISSNDIDNYPEDAPEKMAALAREQGFTFPYLYDESQDVARAYRAACTPDFFLFDSHLELFYRGQFDETRPGSGDAHGKDLREAARALLGARSAPATQMPSMGCNIKWKPGRAPTYFE